MKSWKQLSTKVIRLNRYRTVLKARYRLPSGRVDDFYVGTGPDVVCALVLTSSRRVVLVQQFRPGPNRVVLDLPGGSSNVGESPRAAVRREVLEETGYRGTLIHLVSNPSDGWSRKRRHHYAIVNAVRVSEGAKNPAEPTAVTLLSLTRFRRLLRRGVFGDAETAYLALDRLKLL